MPKSKGPAAQQAYDAIAEKILTFQMLPKEVISDYLLAQTLGMSRTPVREAIQRLVTAGLAVQGANNVFVSEITQQDVLEITQVRMALECEAVEIVLARGGLEPVQLAQMREFNSRLEKAAAAGHFKENFMCDDALHEILVKSTGNRRIIEFIQLLYMQMARTRWLTTVYPNFSLTCKEHAQLIDALEEKDAAAAKQIIREHMESARTHFTTILSNPDLKTALTAFRMIDANTPKPI